MIIEQIISVNPVERAKLPRVGRTQITGLWTPEQLRAFLATADGHRLSAFYRMAAYTGARRGELLFLRWHHIDLYKREITFDGSAAFVEGQRVEGSTKGDRSRVVSLDDGTIAAMHNHRARQLAGRRQAGSLWVDFNYVFTTETGKPVAPDTPTQLMPKLVKSAGLPHARLHDLRHLHASTLLMAGVPVHVVSARLGHADAAITLRVYAHVLKQDTADIGNVFAAAAC